MPIKGRYKSVPRPITSEDKQFISLIGRGFKRSVAFRKSYPNHPTVVAYSAAATAEEKRRLSQSIVTLSKSRIQTKHIQNAMVQYNKKMEQFTDAAVDTAIDLVTNARSEMVRKDLAIEGMRHRVGTPVQKVQVQQEKNVTLTFTNRHPDDLDDIVEGDIVE